MRKANSYILWKICTLVVLIGLCFDIGLAYSQDRMDINGLHLKISFEKKMYRTGEKIPIEVVIKNYSERTVVLPAVMMPEDHWLKFIIVDPSGAPVSYSGPEHKLIGVTERVALNPMYFWGRSIDLTELYRVDKHGHYSIKACYERKAPLRKGDDWWVWRKGDWQGKICSDENLLEIE